MTALWLDSQDVIQREEVMTYRTFLGSFMGLEDLFLLYVVHMLSKALALNSALEYQVVLHFAYSSMVL